MADFYDISEEDLRNLLHEALDDGNEGAAEEYQAELDRRYGTFL